VPSTIAAVSVLALVAAFVSYRHALQVGGSLSRVRSCAAIGQGHGGWAPSTTSRGCGPTQSMSG
jgi:hypothetical protein